MRDCDQAARLPRRSRSVSNASSTVMRLLRVWSGIVINILFDMFLGQHFSCSGKTAMSTLYEDFCKTCGNWKEGLIMKQIRSSQRSGKKACRKWLTRKAMLKYFDNDSDTVDAIIFRKESDAKLMEEEVRQHPECPSVCT